MKIDPDGLKFIAFPLGLGMISIFFFWPLAVFFFVLAASTAFFFRQTVFGGEFPPNAIVSPASGKIIDIREVEESNFLASRARKVSIFMSLLDEHINYAPVNGEVVHLHHRPGSFKRADSDEASDSNESQYIGLQAGEKRILARQVAGTVARRIVCRVRKGERLLAGQKIGLIRFGSRVELYLPLTVKLNAIVGDRVRGGMTVLGVLKNV